MNRAADKKIADKKIADKKIADKKVADKNIPLYFFVSHFFVSFFRYWLPAALWMAVIFWFSTDSFSAQNTGSFLETLLQAVGLSLSVESLDLLHFLVRKGAHLTAYAILAWLLFRAIRADSPTRWRSKWAALALLITAGYAFLDEYHQSLTTQRTGAFADSLLDILGGFCGLVILKLSVSSRQVRDREI